MTEKIREVTGKMGPTTSTNINDASSNLLADRDEVLKRLQEYYSELYSEDGLLLFAQQLLNLKPLHKS